MRPKLHFISGLPRSGSTSLAGLLRQNPRFAAAMTGPVGSLVTTLLNSISDNSVESRLYVNLFGSVFVDADKRFELFGSINNLFNTDPPAAPETQFYTNPVYFDTLGRYFRFGGRVKL